MEKSIAQELDKLEKLLKRPSKKSAALTTAADRLLDEVLESGSLEWLHTLSTDSEEKSEFCSTLPRALTVLGKVQTILNPDSDLSIYIEALTQITAGDYKNFLQAISRYTKSLLEQYEAISYDIARKKYENMFDAYFPDKKDANRVQTLRRFYRKLKQLCPGSAFEKYIKYYLVEPADLQKSKNYLLDVVQQDDSWYKIYSQIAWICYRQEEWADAAQYYEKAVENERRNKRKPDAWEWYCLASAYRHLHNNTEEERAYRECLKFYPRLSFMNNDLGRCLYRQRRYEEALRFFEKSIQLGADGVSPYRNKFKTLIRMSRVSDAVEFAETYPQHFRTQSLQRMLQQLSAQLEGAPEAPAEGLEAELAQTTESPFAGKITVADEPSNLALYPHQQEAIRAMDRVIPSADEYAGLLVLPTGGGKTLTAVYWLMENILDRGGKVVWLAHRHELLNQAKESFEKVCYKDISKNGRSYRWRILSGQHDRPIHIRPEDDILIASKSSLRRGQAVFTENWLKPNRENIFLVIDEAHHATAKEYRELIDCIRKETIGFKMLGLTATPFRTAEGERGLLKKVFPDDIVYKIDLRELINRGILSEPVFCSVPTNIDMEELFRQNHAEEDLERLASGRGFDLGSIGEATAKAIAQNAQRNRFIVDEYVNNREKYGQTLVFALSVDMAIVLSDLFRDANVQSDYVVSNIRDSDTGVTISGKDNIEKIQKFREGELKVLVNYEIVTEGTDLPKVQSVFLARPTKSTILMTQMIGRALRGEKAGGTRQAYVVSFIDDWRDRIAWVNPEQLFIDENVDFSGQNRDTQNQAMRLVSISKMEEFSRIANGTVDERLAEIPFIKRMPVGIYHFSYLVPGETDGEDIDKTCDILVYDCMRTAYEMFLNWLPKAELSDEAVVAEHIDATLFGEQDKLLGYRRQDLSDIIRFYRQTKEVPQMIPLAEREKYDVARLARYIREHDLSQSAEAEYIAGEWEQNSTSWSAFFGVNRKRAFINLIDEEKRRLQFPESYQKPAEKPVAHNEPIPYQELPLQAIRERNPDLGDRLRNAVFAKYMDEDGFYHSAKGDFRSKNRLDFQIDHIKPLSKGGLTIPENLQLLTRAENMVKGDR